MTGSYAYLAHLAALLLTLAMVAPASRNLRLGVIAAALVALAYAFQTRHPTVIAAWASLLLAVNAIQFLRIEYGERRARFSARDEHLRKTVLPDLSRAHARSLIDCGNWLNGKAGERLLTEGESAAHLFFLHQGAAAVSLDGALVGGIAPGDLIGDATAISGAPATATVDLSEPSELWCIWGDELRNYLALHPHVRTAFERRLNESLRRKLSGANRRLAERG